MRRFRFDCAFVWCSTRPPCSTVSRACSASGPQLYESSCWGVSTYLTRYCVECIALKSVCMRFSSTP